MGCMNCCTTLRNSVTGFQKRKISSEMPNTDSKYMRFLYGYTALSFASLTTEFPMPAYLEMTCAS